MSIDRYVEHLSGRLRRAARVQASVFFACCAERFYPLYEAFSSVEQWGDTEAVRACLDLAWRYPSEPDTPPETLHAALERLLDETPHADDFESVETTLAQDVCGLVAAALGSLLDAIDETDNSIEPAFEALRVAHCVEATGFMDLGDDQEATVVEASFLGSALLLREQELQRADLEEILSARAFDVYAVDKLRARARTNRYTVEQLLPTQAAGTD